ncbi:MAG: hypothetical protein KDA42_11020 [Planctomycetales bacterium]|nr:hypothetical protein [Planctomycetales bacterium]
MNGRPQLNFVLCPSFHGATLLSLLLNNHSEITSLGDAIPSRKYDQTCACQAKVSECPFWTELGKRLDVERFSECGNFLPGLPLYSTRDGRGRHATRWYRKAHKRFGPGIWRFAPRAARRFAGLYQDFYQQACDLQSATIFVDGSKSIERAVIFRNLYGPRAKMRIIHLYRDPRGYFNSCKKHRDQSAESCAREWTEYHRLVKQEFEGRRGIDYLRICYEDVCHQPSAAMAQLFAFLDVANEDVVRPPEPHKNHLMGNKMLATFDGVVQVDWSWRERISIAEQQRVLQIAGSDATERGYH